MRITPFAFAAALALTALPAAGAVHYSLAGVVASGTDIGFASPGFESPFETPVYRYDFSTGQTYGFVSGQSFTLDITINAPLSAVQGTPNDRYIYGFDADSPGVAVFTLNGVSYTLGSPTDTSALGSVEKYHGPAVNTFGAYFSSTLGRPAINGPFTEFSGDLSAVVVMPTTTYSSGALDEVFSWSGAYQGRSNLQIALTNTYGGPDQFVTTSARTADLALEFRTLKAWVDAPAAVPEPSAWALAILGFGLVGAAVRRRSAVARAV